MTVADPCAAPPAAAWLGIREVIDGALSEIAVRFSTFIASTAPHVALVIFTPECTGRPRKVAGSPEIIDRVTVGELEELRHAIPLGHSRIQRCLIAGTYRSVWLRRDASDTLLLLVPAADTDSEMEPAAAEQVSAMFGIVATSIRQQVAQASPDYLAGSRAASQERARAVAQLSETHEATLSAILRTLRSSDLDDRKARVIAGQTASAALLATRSVNEADRALSEESVLTAFARLREELSPLFRGDGAVVEFAEPPADGRPLPGEVAHGSRAVVRSIVIACSAQPVFTRLRIAWDCDGRNVIIEVRDQSSGDLDRNGLLRQLAGRVDALHGSLVIDTVAGWGNRIVATLPLDPPALHHDESRLGTLNPRELEVLGHLAAGKRNKSIAADLGISESTVKFHVTGLLRKLGVTNRSEAAAVGARAGLAMWDRP